MTKPATRRWSMPAVLLLLVAGAAGAAGKVTVVPPDAALKPVPGVEGVTADFIAGDPAHGEYTMRARLAAGARMPPHTHPDTRTTTVLSGTYWFAEGETFDAAQLRPYPAGTLIVVPAGTPHYSAARDGDALVQESGTGPTAVTPVRH